MLSEEDFTTADHEELERTPIALEMATLTEWIASRPEEDLDQLYALFVAPFSLFGATVGVQVSCSCDRGLKNLGCPEALALLRRFRRNDRELLVQLCKRRETRIHELIAERKDAMRFVGEVHDEPEPDTTPT